KLSPKERSEFPPVCPDFVAEIRSKSDSLKELQKKMEEWMENGCLLSWLLDIFEKKAYIYRPSKETELKTGEKILLSGEDVLPGLEFYLHELYEV
ncbi:MAG TPA: Uma2 family endonuclease, partial [Leptospiraceae bacterium]|nr:Uma2 family endonuclease [Leptospiraceae bacterium]